MSTYTLTLTPALKNFATEGGLDTALVAGKSIQRTGFIPVQDGSSPPNRKVVVVADGGTFDNTTFHTITSLPGIKIA